MSTKSTDRHRPRLNVALPLAVGKVAQEIAKKREVTVVAAISDMVKRDERKFLGKQS